MNFKKISFNSPVILIFTALCFFAFAANIVTSGGANRLFFSVYNSSLTSPLTYFRFIGHVFGHADWAHLSSNIVMILLLGPLLEEKYGAAQISIVVVITAVVTGIINFFIFIRFIFYSSYFYYSIFYTIYSILLLGKYFSICSFKNFSPSFFISSLYLYLPFPPPFIISLLYKLIALGNASSFIFV